jgi:hypothetical protein
VIAVGTPVKVRDPHRSLKIGAIIAAVILAVLAAMVSIGVYLVFSPRP